MGWVAIAVGMVLIMIPEPATTATGLAIVAGAVGHKALSGD